MSSLEEIRVPLPDLNTDKLKMGTGTKLSWNSARLPRRPPRIQFPALQKIWTWVEHTCNPRTGEVEAAGSEVQGHPQLQNEFEVSLGYVRVCIFF